MRPRREKKLQLKPTIERRQTQQLKPLGDPPADRGGKRRSFSQSEVTLKIATVSFTKKSRSPVSLVTGYS
jgi:hypothetical protein